MSSSPGSAARAWLRAAAARERPLLAAAVLAGVIETLAIVAQAALVAWIAGRLVAGAAVPLAGCAAALAAVLGVRALGQWVRLAAGMRAALRIRERVRDELFDRLAVLGPVRLAHWHSAGVASLVVEQVEALEGYFARYLPQVALAALAPLAIAVAVASRDWLAALLLLVSAPLIPAFMALVGLGAEALNRRQFRLLTRLSGVFLDRVRGLSTLQIFGAAAGSVDEVAAAAADYRARSMATLRVAFLSSAVLEFFSSVAIAVVAIYVGFALLGYIGFGPAAELTLATGLFILLLAPEFFQPLRSLAEHYHDRAAALAAADGLLAILDDAPSLGEPRRAAVAPGAIEVQRLTAAYPGAAPALRDFTLQARPGDCVVLRGQSGSGKSTVLRVLAGFLPPSDGYVAVGCSAAGAIAWMGQRPFLMAGTIAENIRLGAGEAASAGAVAMAAEQAGVWAFAERLPAGLDTPLGERGQGLSGGQARRVALARVFLSAAPVALLDEPAEGLDADSEAHVVSALRALAASGRTLVIASHRGAFEAWADAVIDLDDHGGAGAAHD